MRVLFIIGGAIAVGAAAWFFSRGQQDAAFVSVTIGLVAWFLSYRVKMKRIIDEDDQLEGSKGEELNENVEN